MTTDDGRSTTCPHGWHVQRGEGCPEGPGCNEAGRVASRNERLRTLAFEWQKQSEEAPDSLDPEVIAAQIAASEVYANCAFQLDELLDEEALDA